MTPEAAGIRRLSIPTPFAVGRVNCWLVEDDPLTLVDCGPNSGDALDELETGLRALGHRIEDLERIVLTHQHFDHVGLVGILARRSGAEVVALAELLADFRSAYFISGEINSEVADPKAKMEEIAERYGDGELTRLDGISIDYADWHFNVRPSNTEPLLRLNLESLISQEDMERRRDELLALIRS